MKFILSIIFALLIVGCSDEKNDYRTDQDKALDKHNENVEDKLDRSKEIKDKSQKELDSVIK